eukprot:COSAG04_NODE_790_length_10288_cov_51.817254_8_plen_167_part_00
MGKGALPAMPTLRELVLQAGDPRQLTADGKDALLGQLWAQVVASPPSAGSRKRVALQLSPPDARRLARRGGVKRISSLAYEDNPPPKKPLEFDWLGRSVQHVARSRRGPVDPTSVRAGPAGGLAIASAAPMRAGRHQATFVPKLCSCGTDRNFVAVGVVAWGGRCG